MSFWYLASPYTNYPGGRHAAFQAVCVQAGLLIAAKIPIFCPIAHSHPIQAVCEDFLKNDHDTWLPADQPMIDAGSGLIVLKLEGWDTSYGVNYEIDQFTAADKPLVWMRPGVVPADLLPGGIFAGPLPASLNRWRPRRGPSQTGLTLPEDRQRTE